MPVVATGQLTLTDLNDAIIGGSAPTNPIVDTLWIDSSTSPPKLKKWSGSAWVIQNLSIADLDPNKDQIITDSQQALSNLSNDARITQAERKEVKEAMMKITGVIIANTSNAPTTATMDSSAKGDFYSARKKALNAGLASNHADYVDIATKYNTLVAYLNALSPKPWDTASTAVITVVADTWRNHWLNYYTAYNKLEETVATKLKDNVDSIVVGGRNLLRDSNHLTLTPGMQAVWQAWGGNTATVSYTTDTPTEFSTGNSIRIQVTTKGTGGSYVDLDTFTLQAGKTYTMSFYAKSQSGTIAHQAHLASLNRISDNIYITSGTSFIVPTAWTRFSYQFTVTTSTAGVYRRRHIVYDVDTIWLSHVQLEEGNKVTDWKPSPDDTPNLAPGAGRNLLRNTDFAEIEEVSYGWDKNLNGTQGPTRWSLYNSGVPVPATGWHANLYTDFGYPVIRFNDRNSTITGAGTHRWMAATQNLRLDEDFCTSIQAGKTYVLSMEVRADTLNMRLNVGFHHYTYSGGTTRGFYGYQWFLNPSMSTNIWEKKYVTFTIDNAWDITKDALMYVYGHNSSPEGTMYVKNIMLEEGVFPSAWRVSGMDNNFRITTLENDLTDIKEITKPDGLYTQIKQSQNYINEVEGYALASDLEGLATSDGVKSEIEEAIKPYKEFLEDLDTSPYVKQAEYEQTVERFQSRFTSGGGANLLQNSVGFNDFNFWSRTSNNMVPNSGMFENTSGFTLAAGWTRDTTDTFYGIPSGKCVVSGLSADAWRGWFTPYFPATPGRVFTGSFWVMFKSGANIDRSVAMELEWFNGTTRISTASLVIPVNMDGKWRRFTVTGTTPTNTTQFRLRIHCTRNGTFWASAPQVEESPTVSPYGLEMSETTWRGYTRQNDTLQTIGTGSSMMVQTGGRFVQTVTLPPLTETDAQNKIILIPFTFSVMTKLWNGGQGYIRVYDGSSMSNNYQEAQIVDGEYKKHGITVIPSSGTITVEIGAHEGEVEFTGAMLNVGDVAYQWQQNTRESHNATIRQDITGIKVFKNNADGTIESMTAMTPDKFAGYYDTNQDGIIDTNKDSVDEVFRMDKDEFLMKKAVVKDEITMGNIKIVNTPTGWAIVGLD
ncbi:carbohydrate binding domain protein [Exiguobacterium phage vB_EalM-132]|nr:carbohydrate binding domain protein [Exiguobacterium phage vB_EalM-132]